MATPYRALFISDVHLGTRWAQAPKLLELLEQVRAETVYLVGDIVDFWRIRRGLVWPQPHSDVLVHILQLANAGTRVVFIPGNHDADLRAYCDTRFGNIEICRDAVHVTAEGKRYLVTHGDQYDLVMRRAQWLALLGERGYAAVLMLNRPLNWFRNQLGMEYWSISSYLKQRVKACVGRAGNFEQLLIGAARERQASGVICGHIHHAASRQVEDVHYVNTGDWVESCTAVVETSTGSLELINWADGAGLGQQPTAEMSRSGTTL